MLPPEWAGKAAHLQEERKQLFSDVLTMMIPQVMSEGVATFSGLFLDRSGHNVKLRFSLYNFDRSTADWNEAGVYFDTEFFRVEEGLPAALLLEQVELPNFYL